MRAARCSRHSASARLPQSANDVVMELTVLELPTQREAIDAALGASREPRH